MSTKHTVTLPDGTTATRTSANRTYAAAVAVGPVTREHAAESTRDAIAQHERRVAKYAAVVTFLEEGGQLVARDLGYGVTKFYLPGEKDRHENIYVPRGSVTPEQGALPEYREFMAGSQDAAKRCKAALAEILAGPDLIGNWYISGWNGTPALAAKAARQQEGHGREVRVLTEIAHLVK